MRLRKQKNFDKRWQAVAPRYLLACENGEQGNCVAVTGQLHLELGCGKGHYLTACAARAPDITHIGVERNRFALLIAMEMAQRAELGNIRFIDGDIEYLADWFSNGQVARLDLLFSDPWPKDRYAKRRLTHRRFLEVYRRFLAHDGIMCVRTDNQGLFDFTLEEFAAGEWEMRSLTRDKHRDCPIDCDCLKTGYEWKFTELGQPIYEAVVVAK